MSYTLVIPNEIYLELKKYDRFAKLSSRTIEISNSCNPNYITSGRGKLTCLNVFERGQCDADLLGNLRGGIQNTNGHWETRLHCPECGCGTIGALDLNDIAEKEGWRK